MKDWIQRNIDPPGIEKKNRGSLFSLIGRVFGVVKDDARKAFNAFFPYLCDPEKLKEHANSLLIPEIPYDTEEELRERVSTASFFLMGAGERGYVREQLTAHFGDRHMVSEDFLNVYVKITDLDDKDRAWTTGFLDGILDPNIAMTVAEWFHFIEYVLMRESQNSDVLRADTDVFQRGLCCDGRFLCDQGKATLCDGSLKCDGSWTCDDFQLARGTVYDTILASIFPNGAYRCDGSFDCSGYIKIYDPMALTGPITPRDEFEDRLAMETELDPLEDQAGITPLCDGAWNCDGSNFAPVIDAPMKLRVITPMRCDGRRTPSCSTCDGTWACDGSHNCFDGWYCSGDLITEEVV
ncbi:MAG: hypothetical protein LBL20_00160 [Treponema sp.]|jgi:hypothetical protein|nr:hypothetical protein [Treponema sp.]